MRLFIAIDFSDKIKSEIEGEVKNIKALCDAGRFSHKENYHITLAFLGEVPFNRVEVIKRVMNQCNSGYLGIKIGKIGSFKRDGGDILWRKIDADAGLLDLRTKLVEGLICEGFDIEKGKFSPHLTLARQVRLAKGVGLEDFSKSLKQLEYTATEMVLMCSERIDGKLTYTPIYKRRFRKEGGK